jgi:hypothetical protein
MGRKSNPEKVLGSPHIDMVPVESVSCIREKDRKLKICIYLKGFGKLQNTGLCYLS